MFFQAKNTLKNNRYAPALLCVYDHLTGMYEKLSFLQDIITKFE
jgi:hypothetical protein